ncbi:HPF/RaiA family ribosome-associated protein [Candidatus Gracilibacteria bacterium]|nr:HPF/RaiA family ribosome-associated protein [Candidatus Gracilibacteria bacterium]MCF7856484.1 HPF/RaiA family ribosome-associated protein [Candidatus Gracilibacteria bacterium]MCF7896780.1 HPF/RaiA family ribosome-associated protein [Candidatus Gracilibacteria bacterium]
MQFDSWNEDGYTLTDEDKKNIVEKISKLAKFSHLLNDESVKVHVEVVRGKKHESPNFGLRVQVTVPGKSLRAEASGKTISDAVDEVERKLRAQIEKFRN